MKGIVFFWILLLAGWMAGAEYVWLCQVKNHCGAGSNAVAAVPGPVSDALKPVSTPNPEQTPTDPAIDPGPLTDSAPAVTSAAPDIVDQERPATRLPSSSIALTVAGQTLYASAPLGFEPNQWRLSAVSNGPDVATELAQILQKYQALDITISGQYRATEKAPQGHSDMGMARAQSLIDALADAGIARDRMTHNSVPQSDENFRPGLVLDATDLSALLEPQAMHFDTASAAPRPTPQLERYIRDVTAFLRTHRGASVRITGHTDNTGVIDGNDALGLSRARQAAELLATMGLPPTRVRIGSKGQNQPVADNSTAAGRAANRRVEIQLDMGRR